MGRPLKFWFIKGYENPFENSLDIIRETISDCGSKEYRLKGIEVITEAGTNAIHRELTSGSVGKLRAVYLGVDSDTLSPAFAPRPDIGRVIQFRDYAIPAMNIENPLPQESLMELTARLSHKVGPIMLMNADWDTDGYMAFENGEVSSYGFKFTEEFILRFFGGKYKVDIYNVSPDFEHKKVGQERIEEAIKRCGMEPCTISEHDKDMLLPFWHIALEGLNMFYGLKLATIGTWEANLATLENVSDPGVGLYDIFPEGVSYSYPDKPPEEKKKPWWKVW